MYGNFIKGDNKKLLDLIGILIKVTFTENPNGWFIKSFEDVWHTYVMMIHVAVYD